MWRFSVAFLANGVLKVTHGGIELTTPVLLVRMLNHYITASPFASLTGLKPFLVSNKTLFAGQLEAAIFQPAFFNESK